MLAQRVMTAIVLLAVLLGTLLAPSHWPLVVLLILTAASALWEWLRLTWPSRSSSFPLICAALVAMALAVLASQWLASEPAQWSQTLRMALNHWWLPAVSIVWILAATAMVVQGQASAKTGGACLSVFAVAAIVAVWAALVQLYLTYGAWFLVSLLAMIWFADIAAYFSGKAFGRHKLAPKVSPGKTLEGAFGGIVAATLWVVASSYWDGSFGQVLMRHWSLGGTIIIAACLAALSIVGDLFESLLKRRAGFKDSSQLLPGHGGVYDRIDALLPVAPIALLLTGVPFQ